MSFLKRKGQAAHLSSAGHQDEPPAEIDDVIIYDAEATGLDTFHDQILQFGGIRCDGDLNQLGPAVNLKVRRLPYVVPAPEAMAVTGFSYEAIDDCEIPSEFEAAGEIHSFMKSGRPGSNKTCVTFNGLRYDDMILRMMWFRNLLDPYPLPNATTTKVDMFRVAQLAFTACPGKFTRAPSGSEGAWRLETLCKLNDIAITAHDGLSDTLATRDLAALVRKEAAWAWDTAITCGNQDRVNTRLVRASKDRQPLWLFLHGDGPELKPMLSIGTTGKNRPWLMFDLDKDPADIKLEELGADMAAWRGQGLWKMQPNKMPLLIGEVDAARFDITPDRAVHRERADRLMDNDRLVEDLKRQFAAAITFPAAENPTSEQQIYDRFTQDADRAQMRAFRAAGSWAERCLIGFDDERIIDFSCRILAMTAPQHPSNDEQDALVYIRNRAREAYSRPYRTEAVDWTTLMSGAETGDDAWLTWVLNTFSPTSTNASHLKAG